MMMNSGIILSGQQPDILGRMQQGAQMAQFQNDAQHQNAFRSMLQQNGPGIMSGDQNALASLAQFDPQAALGVQQTRQMQLAYQAAQRAALTASASMSAAQREQENATLQQGIAMLTQAQTPEQWQRIMAMPGLQAAADAILGPGMATFDNRGMVIAGALGVRDALGMGQGPQPDYGSTPQGYARVTDPNSPAGARLVQIPGMDQQQEQGFRRATTDEAAQYGAAAGQFGPDGRFYAINPPSGMSLETNPDGSVRLSQGPGVGSRAEQARVAADQQRQQQGGIVLQDINRTLDLLSSAQIPVTGPIGNIAAGVPGTAAHDVSQLLQTIGANVSFDALTRMRQASPTGGALGAVSDRETSMLRATMGSLDQSQSADQFRRNLTRLRDQFAEVVYGRPEQIATMTIEQLSSLPEPELTSAQVEAAVRRFEELQR